MRVHGSVDRLRPVDLLGTLLTTIWLASAPATAQVRAPLFPDSVTVGVHADWSAVAEFNGDGKPDLATSWFDYYADETTVTIAFGQSNGTFTPGRSFSVSEGYVRVVLGDFNADVNPDLATTDWINGSVSILLGQGDGSFTTTSAFPMADNPSRAAVGDFNGDGKQDLVISSHVPSVTILLGDGDGSFTTSGSFSVAPESFECVVADFNGDGVQDLAAMNYGEFKDYVAVVSILLGNGDGSFASKGSFPISTHIHSAVAGDFNEDGKQDLAMPDNFADTVTILLGQADGSLASNGTIAVGHLPWGVEVGDVNGDGTQDLVTVSSGFVTVLLGKGDGSFTTSGIFDYGPFTYVFLGDTPAGPAAVGDFNTDGKQDLATTTPAGVTVILGQGNGSFTGKVSVTVGLRPMSIASADFNGDGAQDLATADFDSDTVSIVLGQGDGTFATSGSIAIGYLPTSVVTADFDGDEMQDLAATTYANGVSILLGQGDGSFTISGSLPIVEQPNSAVVGDFNGDGNSDLATVNVNHPGPSSATIFLGQGTGSFTSPGSFTTGIGTIDMAVGDLNGDGMQDLATADNGSDSVSILLGLGDGSFASSGNFSVPRGPVSIVMADIDDDGNQDLVTANRTSGSVGTALGQGDGSFGIIGSVAAGDAPSSVRVADFDGNGILDVAAADAGFGSVSILLGRGTGAFASNGTFAVGQSPNSLALADFNADGNPDVATADSGLNTASILLNQLAVATSAWVDLGSGLPGAHGIPLLTGTGVQTDGSPVSIDLSKAKPSSLSVLFVSPSSTATAFKGGTLIPNPPQLAAPMTTGSSGMVSLPFDWPSGLPPQFSIFYQYGIEDADAVQGVALSNALKSTSP